MIERDRRFFLVNSFTNADGAWRKTGDGYVCTIYQREGDGYWVCSISVGVEIALEVSPSAQTAFVAAQKKAREILEKMLSSLKDVTIVA